MSKRNGHLRGIQLTGNFKLMMLILSSISLILFLASCFEKTTAGTSSGTGNPEISVVIVWPAFLSWINLDVEEVTWSYRPPFISAWVR